MVNNGGMTPDPSSADPYVCLGVSRNASPAEIKSTYRRLARELHPDKNQAPDAADQFDNLTRAYMTLQQGSSSTAKDVSQETVMVLLAEAEVGSVEKTFEVSAVANYGGSSAGASRGLLCLGQHGIAFVRRADPQWLSANRKRAVLSFTPDQSPDLSVPSLDGSLTLSGGSRSVTFILPSREESVLRHHFHEVFTSTDPTAQYFITEYAGLVENAPKRSNSKWLIAAIVAVVVVAVVVVAVLLTVNSAGRSDRAQDPGPGAGGVVATAQPGADATQDSRYV